MIRGSAQGSKSKFNFGELWHTNLCYWPIANSVDTADLWGDRGQNRGSYNSLLAVLRHKWFADGMRQKSLIQMGLLSKLCERVLPFVTS